MALGYKGGPFEAGVSEKPEMTDRLKAMADDIGSSQAYISKRLAEETVETVERTTITIKAPGFVFGAAICISVAGLIAIGFCVGLLF